MKQRNLNIVLLIVVLSLLHKNNACQMSGVTIWDVPIQESILDTFEGTFFNRSTTNIRGISTIFYREGLNRGPYLTVSLVDSEFTISTNDAFKDYEEYETVGSMGVTVTFICDGGGSTTTLVVGVDIVDTNNNAPRFLPSDNYKFYVFPPVPPGYAISGCDSVITVRDIDLTTHRIDFAIEENPYVEIFYDTSSSTPKEFNAILRSKTLIRSLSEPLMLTITGKDVDETGDPPLTTTASIRIEADSQFRLPDELLFSKPFYLLEYSEEHVILMNQTIHLVQGYDEEVTFDYDGDYYNNFELDVNGNDLSFKVISPVPVEVFNERHLFLSIKAEREFTSGAVATVILQLPADLPTDLEAYFDKALYSGQIQNGEVDHEIININNYEGVILISGEYGNLFEASVYNGVVSVKLISNLPDNVVYLALQLNAGNARTVLLLDIEQNDFPIDSEISFDKFLYNGRIQNGQVIHDVIVISDYEGDIILSGEHEDLFEASVSNGFVSVSLIWTLPANTLYIALQLNAANTGAVLLLDVVQNDPPSLVFDQESYELRADTTYTGLVGEVTATTDNNEGVTYSLVIADDHLQARLFINVNGEIYLSAAAPAGSYHMSVRATTVLTHVTASAPILLFIEENGACNTTYNQPPLVILERYEEEEHLNLVPLNRTKHPLCNYVLTNRWPIDQNWLYVDDEGLHTKSIDREDVSIAFMPVSQIQVELNLHCGSDLRMKRSLSTNGEQNWLGPYDYGANKWILTDSISYNARRTLVNLIVKDINDNSPIFVGLENEPIVVGYPESDIEGLVSPRFLVKVEATDADIGENAAILYWSTDPRVVVSPNTGDVHVHNTATIEDNYRFTVNATDRRGSGNTGSIDVLVKLLSSEEIVVITVQNSFLDDEDQVLSALNAAVDYDIKMLCASVVTGNIEPTYKRQQSDDLGVSLRLFVYGIKSQEAIKVDRLTSDLSDSNIVTVNIASVLSLQDHLDKLQICPLPGRDTGLLVATIVLAGIVLIITLTVAVCFFLKRAPL
ncbi:unnamed protein product [Leptidea sinapis]|uniref:Cadherin domain-containing protein n=1 Tax=Leptidea sinapis TaxID=189913 RepID=A0A5E4R1C4_9NEOP|nr:unnamed protein product [Leptidea sinapis]